MLIVRARSNRKRWVLPKGTVEDGEKPQDAALREVREEAGVTGRVLCHAGTVKYGTRQGLVQVEYYLVRYRRPVSGETEDRKTRWFPVEDAIKKLTYASARRILLESHPRIVRHRVR